MEIKEITYEQQLTLRQYEPCKLTVTATVNKGEDPTVVTEYLKRFVQGQLKKIYYEINPDKAPKQVAPVAAPLQNADQPKPGTKKVAATPQQKTDPEEEMPDLI